MRIWSLHPKFLDSKGLVALWRETLLARKVLEGKTKGYKNHPQLERFKKLPEPIATINSYLWYVFEEARARGYDFDEEKIYKIPVLKNLVPVTTGQLKFELNHLLSKLKVRDPECYDRILKVEIEPNPVFYVIQGEVEPWEKIGKRRK